MSIIKNTVKKMEEKGMITEISIVWSAEDILNIDKRLTAEQVQDVLTMLDRKHDASIGINWDTIRYTIDRVKERY